MKGVSPFRNEIMTVDDVTGYGSLILNEFKFVNGSSSDGLADGWLGSNNNSDIQGEKYIEGVLNSKVGKTLHLKLRTVYIQKNREKANVKCLGVHNECDLVNAPCLFDILNDPCEENNLADSLQSQMELMTREFNERLKRVVPARSKKSGKKLTF